MATCTPTPTLTLFTTVTSTVVITTVSTGVQTLPDTTSTFTSSSCLSTASGTCVSSTVNTGITVIPGGVTTISGPLIITSLITAVNPISTLFASCAPISSIPSSISPSSSQRSSVSSFTPTTFLVTTTPLPTVITQKASSTLDNGVVTVITVISTSTPPPSVVALSTSIAPTPSQSQGSKSSIAIAPIVGGAVGGFSFLIVVVVLIWFLLRKCRGSSEDDGDDDIVFPYPVTRDRGHAQHLDLSHEPKPYMYGHVGGSTHDAAVMAPRSSPSHSRASDGRPDSATALIGPSSGFASMALATGAGGLLSSVPGAQSRGGEVGRQASHSSTGHLPPGAAAPATYLGSSSGSGSTPGSSRYPPQAVNPPSSILSSFPVEKVDSSNSFAKAPLVVSEGGGQSARAEKKSAPDPPLPEGDIIIHMDGGLLAVPDHGLLASGSGSKTPAQPEVSNSDAPPAYVA